MPGEVDGTVIAEITIDSVDEDARLKVKNYTDSSGTPNEVDAGQKLRLVTRVPGEQPGT